MKKVVIFGGGTGLSCILSGLKLFPIDVTTVIAVSDNGSSTGKLKEELNIPAVGDVGKVLLSMANVDEDFIDLLSYRFQKGSLNTHPVRNIVLAALIDLKGNLTEATKYMCKLLDIKGTVLPLTGEKIDLVGESTGKEYFGEEAVSRNIRNISRLTYDHSIRSEQETEDEIGEADLIIFSAGSLYTSIIPHLLAPEVRNALEETRAPLLYISNLVTQPGETDIQSVSQHVEVLNEYLGSRKIDLVVANNGTVDEEVRERYLSSENKRIVQVDHDTLAKMGVQVIEDDIFCIENEKIRHNALKTAFLIFSYLMEG